MKTITAVVATAFLFAASPALADGDSHVETRVHVAPVVAGASLFGTTYAFSVVLGADTSNAHSFDAMYVPIAGPFITAGQALTAGGGQFGYFSVFVVPLVIADGLAQLTGAALLVYGLATPKKVTVHDAPHFSVTPVVGKTMTGVGASFAF